MSQAIETSEVGKNTVNLYATVALKDAALSQIEVEEGIGRMSHRGIGKPVAISSNFSSKKQLRGRQ